MSTPLALMRPAPIDTENRPHQTPLGSEASDDSISLASAMRNADANLALQPGPGVSNSPLTSPLSSPLMRAASISQQAMPALFALNPPLSPSTSMLEQTSSEILDETPFSGVRLHTNPAFEFGIRGAGRVRDAERPMRLRVCSLNSCLGSPFALLA